MKIIDRKFLNVTTSTCHASTMAFFRNEPVFAWFGGTMEGSPDCCVYVQYGDTVAKFNNDFIPQWNPILFTYEDKLFLFLKSGLFCDRWQTFIVDLSRIFEYDFQISTHSTISLLPAGLNGPVKTKPIVKNGIVYCGSSVETIYDWSSYIEGYIYDRGSNAFVFASRTSPLTVDKKLYQDPMYGKRLTNGVIQPSLWVDKNGYMNAFFRSSKGLGKIYHSISKDETHETWSSPIATDLDNPNSGVDVVRFNDRLFLIHNPDSHNRRPLVVSELQEDTLSVMESMVVRKSVDIEDKTYSQELSYPYMIENKGRLHCVYTYGRSKIEYCVIDVE